jgi:glutamate-1-semialdehyde aminotransferase
MKLENSGKWLTRAKSVIPSASQTYSKSYKYYCEGAAPAFLESGEGSTVRDVDGNEYVDFVLALGAIILGYRHPQVDQAIRNQLDRGISFSQPHRLEVELAEKLIDMVPCAEMVRFVKNGSDATTAAIRLARAYTGRDLVACCGYHGFHDWYIGSTSNHRGVPDVVRSLTKTFKYNDIASLEQLYDQYPGHIGAVIMEPIALDYPENDFLGRIRDLTHQKGSVLIFDEVLSGFRLCLGGAHQYFNVSPDLCTFGKALANGMPLSAVVGRKDIMELIDRETFISMTFGGETLSLAASLATLAVLERKGTYPHLWRLGETWLWETRELIGKKGLTPIMKIIGPAPHSGVAFSNVGSITATDWLSLYQQELVSRGILTLGINNYCLAHTMEDVQKYIRAMDKALDVLVQAWEKGSVEPLMRGKRIEPIFKRN